MKFTREQAIQEALLHANTALDYARRDLNDPVVLDAIALRLVAMIEALGMLPEADLRALLGTEWPNVRGMRNRIVHGYSTVDADVVQTTVESELPELVAQLRCMVASDEDT